VEADLHDRRAERAVDRAGVAVEGVERLGGPSAPCVAADSALRSCPMTAAAGRQALADHVPHGQGHRVAVELDDVEPVAADERRVLGRPVARGDLHAGQRTRRRRQHRPLQREPDLTELPVGVLQLAGAGDEVGRHLEEPLLAGAAGDALAHDVGHVLRAVQHEGGRAVVAGDRDAHGAPPALDEPVGGGDVVLLHGDRVRPAGVPGALHRRPQVRDPVAVRVGRVDRERLEHRAAEGLLAPGRRSRRTRGWPPR
jgi:hypothetical protein